jgi:hypothetical protein
VTSVRLIGGLGNQLFQVAAGLAIELKLGVSPKFDASWFAEKPTADTGRSLEVQHLVSSKSLRSYPRVLTRLAYSTRNPLLVRERGPEHDVIASAELDRHSWLDGYYQFSKYPTLVADDLVPRIKRHMDSLQPVSSMRDLAVHVRLGDYYENPVTRAHHGLLEPSYFARALQCINADEFERVLVFTDSPAVLMREYATVLPSSVVIAKTGGAWETLAAIAKCGGIVTSNSSLSWWAAFVACYYSHGIPVVLPAPWLGTPGPADSNLSHPGWKTLAR